MEDRIMQAYINQPLYAKCVRQAKESAYNTTDWEVELCAKALYQAAEWGQTVEKKEEKVSVVRIPKIAPKREQKERTRDYLMRNSEIINQMRKNGWTIGKVADFFNVNYSTVCGFLKFLTESGR